MQNTKHKRVQPCNLPSTTMRNTHMSGVYNVGPRLSCFRGRCKRRFMHLKNFWKPDKLWLSIVWHLRHWLSGSVEHRWPTVDFSWWQMGAFCFSYFFIHPSQDRPLKVTTCLFNWSIVSFCIYVCTTIAGYYLIETAGGDTGEDYQDGDLRSEGWVKIYNVTHGMWR